MPSSELITSYYGDFSIALIEAVEKEASTLSLFRDLRLAHIEITSFCTQMENNSHESTSHLVTVLRKALGIVEVELDIVRMRIGHYGLTFKPTESGEIPVFWSKDYTVTDLMELIVALYECRALVYRDGSRVSLAALVRLFERVFNIAIKDPRGLKSNVTSRKIKPTRFLDVLYAGFVELCEV